MSDWVIIRIGLEDPEDIELVQMMANVPIDWKKYIKKIAVKEGRYVPAKILYQHDYFKPESSERIYRQTEEDSEH